MDESDTSVVSTTKAASPGPWLHAWYDPLAGKKHRNQMLNLMHLKMSKCLIHPDLSE